MCARAPHTRMCVRVACEAFIHLLAAEHTLYCESQMAPASVVVVVLQFIHMQPTPSMHTTTMYYTIMRRSGIMENNTQRNTQHNKRV